MGKYLIKCDECKKTISTTDNIVESYQGGICLSCRKKIKELLGKKKI